LLYCLEHWGELWPTKKRKEKDQLGDRCKEILCVINKKVGETGQYLSCRFIDFVWVRSNVAIVID